MSKFLFRIRNFVVLKDRTAYIVYNQNKSWENGHTHVNNVNMARTIINLSIKEKIPKTQDLWVFESLLRITSKSQDKYRRLLISKMDSIILKNQKKEE